MMKRAQGKDDELGNLSVDKSPFVRRAKHFISCLKRQVHVPIANFRHFGIGNLCSMFCNKEDAIFQFFILQQMKKSCVQIGTILCGYFRRYRLIVFMIFWQMFRY